jgi:hypothetical protein
MDLFFGIIIVGAIIGGFFATIKESDMGRDHKAWKYAVIFLTIGIAGMWYSLTQFEQQVVKSYEITDTFITNGGSVMKFSKPVSIKKRQVDYARCVSRQETTYEVDVDGGCK